MASRYNAPFDLDAIAEHIGYPLFMKPFDGGQWVGVTRVASPDELHSVYDESGERLMHLQASVEDFDVFVRSLSIGAETMVMRYDPSVPLHARYAVAHDFLTPEIGAEVVADLAPRERVLPLGVQLVRDAREGRRRLPDRLRERLAGRRAHLAALLLPLGDQGARPLVRVLHRRPAADAHQPEHARLLRHRRPRRPRPTRRSSTATARSPRTTSTSTLPRILRRAPRAPRRGDARVRREQGVRRPARIRPCSGRSRSTSTSTSSRTTAACSACGSTTSTPLSRASLRW